MRGRLRITPHRERVENLAHEDAVADAFAGGIRVFARLWPLLAANNATVCAFTFTALPSRPPLPLFGSGSESDKIPLPTRFMGVNKFTWK
jgi:hypothetical protein